MKRKCFLMLLIVICLFIFSGCNKTNKIKLTEGIDYQVRGEIKGKYLDVTKRGYYIDTLNQPDAPYLYIICMGEKNTGGYSLKVKEVNIDDEKTEIIVQEIVPRDDETVTMAITYPTIVVEFSKYQENIIIKNIEGEMFNILN